MQGQDESSRSKKLVLTEVWKRELNTRNRSPDSLVTWLPLTSALLHYDTLIFGVVTLAFAWHMLSLTISEAKWEGNWRLELGLMEATFNSKDLHSRALRSPYHTNKTELTVSSTIITRDNCQNEQKQDAWLHCSTVQIQLFIDVPDHLPASWLDQPN